jgi:hypothetical protein
MRRGQKDRRIKGQKNKRGKVEKEIKIAWLSMPVPPFPDSR